MHLKCSRTLQLLIFNTHILMYRLCSAYWIQHNTVYVYLYWIHIVMYTSYILRIFKGRLKVKKWKPYLREGLKYKPLTDFKHLSIFDKSTQRTYFQNSCQRTVSVKVKTAYNHKTTCVAKGYDPMYNNFR